MVELDVLLVVAVRAGEEIVSSGSRVSWFVDLRQCCAASSREVEGGKTTGARKAQVE